MSTPTLSHPNNTHLRNIVVIGSIAILILTSFVLIASAILTMVSSTAKDYDPSQADLIPVVQNSVTPIPVPMPPMANVHTSPSEVSTPVLVGTSKISVPPVLIPNPPS